MKPSIRSTEQSVVKTGCIRLGRAVMAVMLAVPITVPVDPAKAAEAWDTARAVAGMERLREEISVLTGLAAAQAELLAWNRLRAKTGTGPAVLPARLCTDAALAPWCRVLPATFGILAGGEPAPASDGRANRETPRTQHGQTEDGNQ